MPIYIDSTPQHHHCKGHSTINHRGGKCSSSRPRDVCGHGDLLRGGGGGDCPRGGGGSPSLHRLFRVAGVHSRLGEGRHRGSGWEVADIDIRFKVNFRTFYKL
jgi:hypothetical protein